MTSALPANPFPGPEPLQSTDQIFGRDRETAELVDRLIADRLVLLYSPSGAGKSSLLNAGVFKKMRERDFRMHKAIRVGLEAPAGVNRYVWSCATSLEVPYSAPARLTEVLGESADDLYVFDQFEEVLTADPADQTGRLDFFKQLGEAMRVQGRWAVFAIREDYLAPITDYLEWIPTQLASSMRLNILSTKEARKAILKPIEATKSVTFEDGALDALLSDLAPDGWVEPVQLQVVCKDLWDELCRQKLTIITKALLNSSGSAEVALEKYYGNVVRRVAESKAARSSSISERMIRDWFGESLISSANTRLQVVKGTNHTGTLPNEVVSELERAHLIRSDVRRNDTWCELTHDRLIRPVTQNNTVWKETHLSLLQRETESWVKNGSSPDRLLRGRSLAEASKWARQNPAEVNPKEQEYLKRSIAVRRRRNLVIAASIAVFALILQAYFSAQSAQQMSHLEVVKATAQAAIQASADQPALAAKHAMEAEQLHREGRSFIGRLFDQVTSTDSAQLEREAVTGAYLAATVQHDPRYLISTFSSLRFQDSHCVWFTPDGMLWSFARESGKKYAGQPLGKQAYETKRLTPVSVPEQGGVCPQNLVDAGPSGMRIYFSGPPGWSFFKQPDRVEFDAPKGHSPPSYVGAPGSSVERAAVDPTGRRAAWITGTDNYVYLLDFDTRKVTPLPAGDLEPVSLAFSPDGQILAAGSDDYLVRLWWFNLIGDPWGANPGVPLRAHTDVPEELAFSPDGRLLASHGGNNEIVLWRILPELAPPDPRKGSWPIAWVPGVIQVSVEPDSRESLTVRPLSGSGKDVRHIPIRNAPEGPVKSIFLRRDGRFAAIISGAFGASFEVFDLATGSSSGPVDAKGRAVAIALSDDGKIAAVTTSKDREIDLWSLESGKPQLIKTLTGSRPGSTVDSSEPPRSLAFLPGKQVLAAGWEHVVYFWDLGIPGADRGWIGDEIQLRNTPTALALTPDGKMGASLDEMRIVRFFDVGHRVIVGGKLQLAGDPRGIAFGNDGKTFHVLMDGGRSLSWPIDLAQMRQAAEDMHAEVHRRNSR